MASSLKDDRAIFALLLPQPSMSDWFVASLMRCGDIAAAKVAAHSTHRIGPYARHEFA